MPHYSRTNTTRRQSGGASSTRSSVRRMSTETLITRIPILHKNQTDKVKFKRLFKEYLRRSSEKETAQIELLTKLNPNVDNTSVDQMIDDIWEDPKTVFVQKGKNFLWDLIVLSIINGVLDYANMHGSEHIRTNDKMSPEMKDSSYIGLYIFSRFKQFATLKALYDSYNRKTRRLSTLKKKQHK